MAPAVEAIQAAGPAAAAAICLVALAASALTFFSGFGLGTLLLPAFALFYPVEVAVASTAVVHFLNSLFKLTLVGRHADWRVVLRFGLPAILAAVVGAFLLVTLSAAEPLARYRLGGIDAEIVPVKLMVGTLLLVVTILESTPLLARAAIPPRYLPVGGLLSGLFGGLAGMQGALRSAFLIRLGLGKEAFIGTGVVVAALVDLSRIGVYARDLAAQRAALDLGILAAAVLCAFAGAVAGQRLLQKVTLATVQRLVSVMLAAVALGLVSGLL